MSTSFDGIIIPPLNIKSIIDKTSDFVARNGQAFEARIQANERNNPKFSFLKPTNQYHAYYRKTVRTLKGEEDVEEVAAIIKKEKEQSSKIEAAAVELIPPEPEKWIINLPDISALDLEFMKLTAQFVARNGNKFRIGLMNREQRNPQFDFLKPMHHLHRLFVQLEEAYTKILLPGKDVGGVIKNEQDKQYLLDKVLSRVEWERAQKKVREQEDQDEKERMARAQIEWHDFVVVEVIDFEDDEKEKEGEEKGGEGKKLKEKGDTKGEVEMDMDMDMDMDMEMEEEVDLPEPEMKIRKDYQRKLPGTSSGATQFTICPKCNEKIPVEEFEQHMKIELLDQVERKKRLAQIAAERESTLAEGREVASSLARLASRRTDIFGKEGEVEIGKRIGEQDIKPKSDSHIWDGHSASIGMTANAVMSDVTLEDIQARQEEISTVKIGPTKPEQVTTTSGLLPDPTQRSVTTTTTPSSSIGRGTPVIGGRGRGGIPPVTMGRGRGRGMGRGGPIFVGAPGSMGRGYPGMHQYGHFPPGVGRGMPGMSGYGGGRGGGRGQMFNGGGVPPPSGPPGIMVPPGTIQRPPQPGPPGSGPPGSTNPPLPNEGRPPQPPHAPPPGPEQPSAKKRKTDNLIPEDEFISNNTGPITLKVQVPETTSGETAAKPEWKLEGQLLEVEMELTETVKILKQKLSDLLGGMPPNKQKLERENIGFLKDNLSIAHYNFTNESPILILGIKARGRRRR